MIIKVRELEIDIREGDLVYFTKKTEVFGFNYYRYKIVTLLVSNIGTVFSTKEIIEAAWGKKTYVTNHKLGQKIRRINSTLGFAYIQKEGAGYKFISK